MAEVHTPSGGSSEHAVQEANASGHVSSVGATEDHGGEHAAPTAFGLDAAGWVSLAMLAVFALLIWKKVPSAIGKSLDKKIAAIRQQLDEASQLRAEAEALRAEYEAKAAQADAEAATMIERAKTEAA